MKTGWLKDGDKWYYLNQNGDMKTGWLQDGNKWYYLNQNGDMLYNAFIAGYRLGSDGAWIDDNLDNVTTGAAVNIITDPTVNTTTGAAVTLPNDYDKYLDQYNKKKDKLENLVDKYNKKLDEQAQKIEKKVNNAWQFFYR
jgi:glucan-binding YG repeat protein